MLCRQIARRPPVSWSNTYFFFMFCEIDELKYSVDLYGMSKITLLHFVPGVNIGGVRAHSTMHHKKILIDLVIIKVHLIRQTNWGTASQSFR